MPLKQPQTSSLLYISPVATVPILTLGTLAFIGEGRGRLQDSHQFLIGIEGGVGDLNDATRQIKFSEKKSLCKIRTYV